MAPMPPTIYQAQYLPSNSATPIDAFGYAAPTGYPNPGIRAQKPFICGESSYASKQDALHEMNCLKKQGVKAKVWAERRPGEKRDTYHIAMPGEGASFLNPGKKWISGAIKRPGALRAKFARWYGLKPGKLISRSMYSKGYARAKREGDTRTMRQINMARTLRKIGRKRKAKKVRRRGKVIRGVRFRRARVARRKVANPKRRRRRMRRAARGRKKVVRRRRKSPNRSRGRSWKALVKKYGVKGASKHYKKRA